VITNRDISKLAKLLKQGDRPALPHMLYHVLHNYKWYLQASSAERDKNFVALVSLGLLTEKGFPSRLGQWYLRTSNTER
jgi:hypothetical protein